MATIYELTEDLMKLYSMASDPEIDEETLADTIEGVEGELEVKADGYAKVIRQMEGDIASIKAEMDRLASRKKLMENSKDRIKKALESAMRATGKTKFKTDLFSFGIQKNPPSLKLADDLDVNTIPPEYIVWPEPTIDKTKVKDVLKAGEELEWAHLESTEGLRIK